jgi:hypothetical protein
MAHQRPGANGDANLRKSQLDGDLLLRNQLSGNDGAHSGFTEVRTTAGQIFGNSESQRDYIQGHMNRVTGKLAPLRLLKR